MKPSLLAHGADMGRIHFPKVEIDGTSGIQTQAYATSVLATCARG